MTRAPAPTILTAEARVSELQARLAVDADAHDRLILEKLRRALADRILERAPVTHDRLTIGPERIYRVSSLALDRALFDALDRVTIAAELLATRSALAPATVEAIDELRSTVRLARLAYARLDAAGGPP